KADEVVGGGDQVTDEPGALDPAVTGAAEPADGLDPAEDLLGALAGALAQRVAGPARRPPVDGAAPLARVLGDVRGRAARADGGHAVDGVVALVGAERPGSEPAVAGLVEQHGHGVALGGAGRCGHDEVD